MVNDTIVNVRTYIRNQRLRYNFFFCFSKSKRCKKKTSPGGFRFPPGAPLKRPENPFGFSGLFPRSLRQLRNSDAVRPAHPVGADDSVRPQAAPLFTGICGESVTSQQTDVGSVPTELRRIRTALQISTAKLIYRTHSNAAICKSSCTVTGGAYHSSRRVSLCVHNS